MSQLYFFFNRSYELNEKKKKKWYEEETKVSEKRLKQGLTVESKVIHMKTDMMTPGKSIGNKLYLEKEEHLIMKYII